MKESDDKKAQHSVLVIDDDSTLLSTYQIGLESKGFTVYTASNGRQGLKEARDRHPDVILLDLMMPSMNGKDVLEQLKADPITQSIPVIINTALVEDLEKTDVMKLGAKAYTTKSDNDPDTLAQTLKRVVGK